MDYKPKKGLLAKLFRKKPQGNNEGEFYELGYYRDPAPIPANRAPNSTEMSGIYDDINYDHMLSDWGQMVTPRRSEVPPIPQRPLPILPTTSQTAPQQSLSPPKPTSRQTSNVALATLGASALNRPPPPPPNTHAVVHIPHPIYDDCFPLLSPAPRQPDQPDTKPKAEDQGTKDVRNDMSPSSDFPCHRKTVAMLQVYVDPDSDSGMSPSLRVQTDEPHVLPDNSPDNPSLVEGTDGGQLPSMSEPVIRVVQTLHGRLRWKAIPSPDSDTDEELVGSLLVKKEPRTTLQNVSPGGPHSRSQDTTPQNPDPGATCRPRAVPDVSRASANIHEGKQSLSCPETLLVSKSDRKQPARTLSQRPPMPPPHSVKPKNHQQTSALEEVENVAKMEVEVYSDLKNETEESCADVDICDDWENPEEAYQSLDNPEEVYQNLDNPEEMYDDCFEVVDEAQTVYMAFDPGAPEDVYEDCTEVVDVPQGCSGNKPQLIDLYATYAHGGTEGTAVQAQVRDHPTDSATELPKPRLTATDPVDEAGDSDDDDYEPVQAATGSRSGSSQPGRHAGSQSLEVGSRSRAEQGRDADQLLDSGDGQGEAEAEARAEASAHSHGYIVVTMPGRDPGHSAPPTASGASPLASTDDYLTPTYCMSAHVKK